ncbi:LIRP-like [Brevipalpus obovatus]|uniref:LIRP-like n=1 Tax=Brevipalpus obovatus TaxID=246614 RepID=UPI003D9F9FCF
MVAPSRAFILLSVILGIFSMIPQFFGLPQRTRGARSSFMSSLKAKRQSIQLCGSKLHEALELVCQGKFASPKRAFRVQNPLDQQEHMIPGQDDPWQTGTLARLMNSNSPDDPEYPAYFLDQTTAYSVLGSTRKPARENAVYLIRHTRGVADECCRKSCTHDELKSYCTE